MPVGPGGIAATFALSTSTSQCAMKKSGSALRNTTTLTSASFSSAVTRSCNSPIVSGSIRLIGGLLKVAIHQLEDGLFIVIWAIVISCVSKERWSVSPPLAGMPPIPQVCLPSACPRRRVRIRKGKPDCHSSSGSENDEW